MLNRNRYLLALTLVLSLSLSTSAQEISRESLGGPGPLSGCVLFKLPGSTGI